MRPGKLTGMGFRRQLYETGKDAVAVVVDDDGCSRVDWPNARWISTSSGPLPNTSISKYDPVSRLYCACSSSSLSRPLAHNNFPRKYTLFPVNAKVVSRYSERMPCTFSTHSFSMAYSCKTPDNL